MKQRIIRNWLLMSLLLSLIMISVFPNIACASTSVFFIGSTSYSLDGNTYNMDATPYAKNNRTYLPIRYVANALGIDNSNIFWDGNTNTVTLVKGNKEVKLKIGSKSILINGAVINMDVAPEVGLANRTMLPVAYVAQAFGATVSWNPLDQSIIVSYDSPNTLPSSGNISNIIPSEQLNNPSSTDKTIPAYEWDYKSQHWKWDPKFSVKLINEMLAEYREMPHPHYTQMDYLTTYCINMSTEEENLLSVVANCLKDGAVDTGYDKYDVVGDVIAFVQSFTYVSDLASTGFDEYPRYPLETLFAREGDCEDTAILTATLIRELGYGTALIFFDDHCAVGIKGDNTLSGVYYEVNGNRYYYLETTAKGWGIGEIPDDRKGQKAIVLPLP